MKIVSSHNQRTFAKTINHLVLSVVSATALTAAIAQAAAYRYNGSAFMFVPGGNSIEEVFVGADGDVWGLDYYERPCHYNRSLGQFLPVPGRLREIAVGNSSAVWGIIWDEIYRFNGAVFVQ